MKIAAGQGGRFLRRQEGNCLSVYNCQGGIPESHLRAVYRPDLRKISMIDSYSFGAITIDGRKYTADVIVYPDRIDAPWWRREGHRLDPADLQEALAAQPEVLIVGTGCYGALKVPPETAEFVRRQGVELVASRTGEAVQQYNALASTRRAVAALHLTC